MRCAFSASRDFSVSNIYTFFLYAAIGGSLYFVPVRSDQKNNDQYPPMVFCQRYAPSFPFIMVAALRCWSGGLVWQGFHATHLQRC